MGLAKRDLGHKRQKNGGARSKQGAYRPKPPFRTVEGVGSEAWMRLDLGARGVLEEFYNKFNGYNRRNLSLTYREVKHKVSSLVFTRWIWQLIGHGFIDVIRQGRLEKNCTLFGLSNRWRRLSNEPDKLTRIEALLSQIEQLKRQPGSVEKRMKIYKLRKEILRYDRR